jgi:alcohol dehydrogenase
VTRVTVLSDPEKGSKRALIDFRVAPAIALCDPELTYGLPPVLTAGTGMDALTHAVESYTCRAATPLSRPLSLAAAGLVAKNLNRAYDHPEDREARAAMLLGATTAAIAFGNSDVGAVHSLSQAMGGLFDVPHGAANACLLPYVTAFNVSADPGPHTDVARAVGIIASAEAAPKSLVRWLSDLNTQLRIPALSEFGFGVDALPRIAQAAVDNVTVESNLRDVDVQAHLRILRAAWAKAPATELMEAA